MCKDIKHLIYYRFNTVSIASHSLCESSGLGAGRIASTEDLWHFQLSLYAQEPVLIKIDSVHMSPCAWFLEKPRRGQCLGEHA